jgi:hypothetical protein
VEGKYTTLESADFKVKAWLSFAAKEIRFIWCTTCAAAEK